MLTAPPFFYALIRADTEEVDREGARL